MKRFPITGVSISAQRTRARECVRSRAVRSASRLGVAHLLRSGNAQSKPQEYQVKAVYLYNFGKFSMACGPPKDESVRDLRAGPRSLWSSARLPLLPEKRSTIESWSRSGSPASRDATDCRILFISSSEAAASRISWRLSNKSACLTVSDLPGFHESTAA